MSFFIKVAFVVLLTSAIVNEPPKKNLAAPVNKQEVQAVKAETTAIPDKSVPPQPHAEVAQAEQKAVAPVIQPSPAEQPKPQPVEPLRTATPAQAQDIAKEKAAQRGWNGYQWEALKTLWHGESGWNMQARNQYSGACGIPQALPCSKISDPSNVQSQIDWGMSYIEQRYGSPAHALAIWSSRSPHWY